MALPQHNSLKERRQECTARGCAKFKPPFILPKKILLFGGGGLHLSLLVIPISEKVLRSLVHSSILLFENRGVGTESQRCHAPPLFGKQCKNMPLLNPKLPILHNHSFARIIDVR